MCHSQVPVTHRPGADTGAGFIAAFTDKILFSRSTLRRRVPVKHAAMPMTKVTTQVATVGFFDTTEYDLHLR